MNYEMGGTILRKTVKEKALGVTMNPNMKVSEQCRIAASNGNQVLGMIRRNITYKEQSLIIPLYKAIVRPHLEYCIQANYANSLSLSLSTIQTRTEYRSFQAPIFLIIISNLFISEGGILKLLKGFDISKASGPDQIPNKVLRELAIHLAPVHTSLFNQSLSSEILPSGRPPKLRQCSKKATAVWLDTTASYP